MLVPEVFVNQPTSCHDLVTCKEMSSEGNSGSLAVTLQSVTRAISSSGKLFFGHTFGHTARYQTLLDIRILFLICDR